MDKDYECYDKYYERLKRVYNSYGDELAFKLRLKPFETLDLALPNVYKDYCIKNKISKEIGGLMAKGLKEEAEAKKKQVEESAVRLSELEAKEAELSEKVLKIMMTT